MHQALYRKYRPKTFDDVVGQEHITSVLSWEVANKKTSHAYIFCGSAGTGKTSCAKILAKAVNCENPVDGNPCNKCHSCNEIDIGASVEVLEMDAASNTGVDYIREIRDEVIFTPSEVGTKVYIIDEVHMLSEGAFNALLKTLEEPPKNVIFVLATTEIQDIPSTILSRCQRFDFKRLSSADVIGRLNYIAKQESYTIEEEAARLIAHLSQGGMRDAVSLFELCVDRDGKITEENVRASAGICGRETITKTVEAISLGKCDLIFDIISDIYRSSKDISVYISDLISFYRDMLVQKVMKITKLDGLSKDILDVSENELADIIKLASAFTREKIVYHIKLLEEAYVSMNKSEIKRVIAETVLIRMALGKYDSSLEALEARIAELENKLFQGNFAPQNIPLGEPKPSNQENPSKDSSDSISNTKNAPKQSFEDTSTTSSASKELSAWVDILYDYSCQNPSVSPFLTQSSAYYDSTNQKLTIYVKDTFSKMMLTNAQSANALCRIAQKYSVNVVSAEILVTPQELKAKDPLEELL